MFSIYYFRHCSIVFHFNIFPIVFKMYFLLFPSFPQFFSSFAIFSLIFSQLFLWFLAIFFQSFRHLCPWPSFHLCTERRQTWSACGRKWIPSSTCGKNAAGLGHFRANKKRVSFNGGKRHRSRSGLGKSFWSRCDECVFLEQ